MIYNSPSSSTGDGEPVYVLSTLIYGQPSRAEVMLGVRKATPIARRHPGVLSTPTMRVPEELFNLVSPIPSADLPWDRSTQRVRGSELPFGNGGYYQSTAAYTIESLLARKLGVANALVECELYGTFSAALLATENVPDPVGTRTSEWTAMLTFEVTLEGGRDAFPEATTSYSKLIWTPTALVPEAVVKHDAWVVDESLDPFEVCIHGLCVRSAAEVILPQTRA